MKTLILALTASLLMAGCAFSDDDNSQEGRIAEDLREARAEIAPVMGQWTGTLRRGGQVLQVSLSMQETLVPNGTTADGTVIHRAAPAGTFTSLDGRYNQAFTGTFLSSTGELILNASAQTLTMDQIQVLSLFLRGGQLVGSARTPGGYLGEVTLQLEARQNDGTQIDSEQRQAEALRRAYLPMVGIWQGEVINPRGSNTPRLRVQLTVVPDEAATSTGRMRPILRATYDRLDQNNTDVLRQAMSVTYAYENNPPTILMSGTPVTGQNGRMISGYISISGRFATKADGSLDMNRIVGTHTNANLGTTGQMTLRKVGGAESVQESEDAPLPNEEQAPRPTPRPRRR